jgi:nucleotide-binding universal stress UspA family protein
VHLVTAYPDVPIYRETIASSAKAEPIELREVAESVVTRESRTLTEEVMTHAREGDPAEVLINVAQEVGADVLQRFLLGSVSSKLSHHAPISVMVVRDE